MKVFKRYVRNRFRLDEGMVEGWSTEEAIEFCTYYLDINRVGVPKSRHEGRLGGKGTIREKSVIVDDPEFAVLQQAEDVMPHIEEHRQSLQTLYSNRSQAWLDKNIRRNLSTGCDAA
jgi:hypothetical protein